MLTTVPPDGWIQVVGLHIALHDGVQLANEVMQVSAAFVLHVEALFVGHHTAEVGEDVVVGLAGGPERRAPGYQGAGHPVPLLVTGGIGGAHPVTPVTLCRAVHTTQVS